MPTLGTAFVNIRANLSPLKKGLALARKVTRSAMQTISRTIKRAAVIAAAALTAATVAAAKFQNQLAMVSTMLDTRTMPAMAQFSKQLSEMAKQSGQSTKTLAKGLFDILSASIDASKAIGVLRVATRGATAGMTETAVAADAITTLINAYGKSAEDAADILDKLFATVKRGKLTFEELASSIGRVATTASIAGLSMEQLLALTATMTRAGISAAEAMTSISGVMRAFLKPADDAVDTAKEFGLELSSNTLKTKGFLSAVKSLNKATPEQLAKIVPNIRAFKALAVALQDVAGFTFDVQLITNEAAGKTSDAYDLMAKEVVFSFGQIIQKALAMARALGTPLLIAANNLLKRFGDVMGGIETFFNDNAETITAWGNKAVDIVGSVIERTRELFNIAKEEGLTAALKSLFEENIMPGIRKAFKFIERNTEQVTEAIQEAFKFLEPHAFELGKMIGVGFAKAMFGIGDILAGFVADFANELVKVAAAFGDLVGAIMRNLQIPQPTPLVGPPRGLMNQPPPFVMPSFERPSFDAPNLGVTGPRPGLSELRSMAEDENRRRIIQQLEAIKSNTNALKDNTRATQTVVGDI